MEDAIAIYRNRSAYGLRGVGLYDYAGSDAGDSYIHVDVGPGSSAPSLKEGMKREERPSFWYQWIRNPVQGQAYAIYLYESDKISKLLNNLQASGGDPRDYISGLTGGKTRVVVHGEEESSGGDSSYSDTFTEYRGRTKLLQLYLRFRGMYSGSVDGIYGSGTAAGVREFQEENDLDNDGVIVWDGGNTFPMMFPTLRRGQRDSDSPALTRNRNIAFLQTILAEGARVFLRRRGGRNLGQQHREGSGGHPGLWRGRHRRPAHLGPDRNASGVIPRMQGNGPPRLNSTPFVRQYGILNNKWGVLLCRKEYQTNAIHQNSRSRL